MKKLILATTTALLLAGPAMAQGHDGSGGGGLIKDGRYMTFHSAGLYTDPTSLRMDQIPGLTEVSDLLAATDLLGAKTKQAYLAALTPNPNRKYFKVKPSAFTNEVRARIMAEYKRVMPDITSEIALYAVTDTESRTTYLLPGFDHLNHIEKQAILFHEAYWIVNPKASYKNVINAEMAFQAYLENPNSMEQIIDWVLVTGGNSDLVKAAINIDLKNETLSDLYYSYEIEKQVTVTATPIDNKKKKKSQPQIATTQVIQKEQVIIDGAISLNTLFGPEWSQCNEDCNGYIASHVYQLSRKYPQSMFLKVFYDNVSRQMEIDRRVQELPSKDRKSLEAAGLLSPMTVMSSHENPYHLKLSVLSSAKDLVIDLKSRNQKGEYVALDIYGIEGSKKSIYINFRAIVIADLLETKSP